MIAKAARHLVRRSFNEGGSLPSRKAWISGGWAGKANKKTKIKTNFEIYAPIAQLDRASDYESEGFRFDS